MVVQGGPWKLLVAWGTIGASRGSENEENAYDQLGFKGLRISPEKSATNVRCSSIDCPNLKAAHRFGRFGYPRVQGIRKTCFPLLDRNLGALFFDKDLSL